MITKYLTVALGAGMLILMLLVWYMNGVITDLNKEVGQLEVQLIACQASTDNLARGIEGQNKKITDFNTILLSKNKVLDSVSDENQKLQNKVQTQLQKINRIKTDTCDETIDWMLQEAIDENTSTSTE